ncbi:MAG TPA: sigma-70 family RNA polymerase sigma factor [Ktedonobacterales bacterium]|nr:sigma-70 family RNA polymerase sigma factor [Ktedonobacterales bacterium]
MQQSPLIIPRADPPMDLWARGLRWLAAIRDASLRDARDGAGATSGPRAMPSAADQFESFYRQHERDIFGYIWRVTGDEQTANDLTQEVFYRAWRKFEKLRGYERPGAWLFHVATNLALNERRHQRVAGPAATLLGDERAPGDHATQLADRSALRAALEGLPAQQRTALILRELYGYTCDEIAGMLDISRAAAKMTLSRARERLRALYLKEDGE